MPCHAVIHEILENRYSYLSCHINNPILVTRDYSINPKQLLQVRQKEEEFHDNLCVAFGTYKFKKKFNDRETPFSENCFLPNVLL